MTLPRTICLGFLGLITVGTLLLISPLATSSGTWDHPITALFMATSAVCVTGLTLVDPGSHYSLLGQGFLSLLIQVGGLGYMTATTFLLLLLRRKFSLKDRLALQKSLDKAGMSMVLQLVWSIIGLTLTLELTGLFLLLPIFVPEYGWRPGIWLALFHSISAFNNAGFSLFADSLVAFVSHPGLNLVISLLIILGGLGYPVIMEIFLWGRDRLSRRPGRLLLSLHGQAVLSTTIVLLVLGTLGFLAVEFNNPETLGPLPFNQKLMAAWFQSVTTRTAGFNTINIQAMATDSLFLSIGLMFIGASPGSTGGGIKTTTVRILFGCTGAVLRGKETVVLHQRQIPTSLILKAVGMVFSSALAVVLVTMFMARASSHLDFLHLLFETVSAFGTVGLSTGITPSLTLPTQLLLIGTMYLGRVGVLIFVQTILGDPQPTAIRHPEGNLLVS